MILFSSISAYIQNLLLLFTLDLFLNHFSSCHAKKKQLYVKILFCILWACIDLPPFITYNYTVIFIIDLMYTLSIVNDSIPAKILVFLKYEAYYLISTFAVTILHTFLTMDITIYASNELYAEYSTIVCTFYLYVILSMYIIHKKISVLPLGKTYRRYFIAIISTTVVLLVLCSMILGSTIIKEEYVVPLIFALLLIISFLCIFIYRKVVTALEENARMKTETEKYALQLDYQEHIEENIKVLSTLRHDFKNHLIIISEYARSGNQEKLENYIASIQQELAPTQLISTPSTVISSLINAKNETCKRKKITLTFKHDFDKVNIDDFYIVTILSNLLDNAITAAKKCEQGYIKLSISKLDSYLEIDCVNNHQENIIEKHNVFRTTKTERKELHGIGITSIRTTVEKLRGKTSINYTKDTFRVNILIPNY